MGLLEEALAIIDGDRQDSYGSPKESFERIAAIWSVILKREITTKEVALCMIGFKLARAAHKNDYDSILDIAGYCEVWSRI